MNKDIAKGKWLEIKGRIKEQWAELTDDDIRRIDGNMERLEGVLRQKLGYTKEQAKQAINSL